MAFLEVRATQACAPARSNILISSMLVAHHLIMFARDASRGRQNASNYRYGCARHRSLPNRPVKNARPPDPCVSWASDPAGSGLAAPGEPADAGVA